jgi:hypothetical protein
MLKSIASILIVTVINLIAFYATLIHGFSRGIPVTKLDELSLRFAPLAYIILEPQFTAIKYWPLNVGDTWWMSASIVIILEAFLLSRFAVNVLAKLLLKFAKN